MAGSGEGATFPCLHSWTQATSLERLVDSADCVHTSLASQTAALARGRCPLSALSTAAYPSAYAPVSTTFAQQPSALPQQQREGEGQGGQRGGPEVLRSGSLP